MVKLCECGCGVETKRYCGRDNRFIIGHNQRGKTSFKKGKKLGYAIWNKGLTKETDERILKYSEKHSKIMKEKHKNGELVPWNKGLTKETDERVKKFSKNYPKNRKKPNLTKEQIGYKKKSFTGKNNPNFNFNKTEFQKYKINCKFKFDLGKFPKEFELNKVKNMFHPIKNKEGYTRDHIFSIYNGFNEGINPSFIKHPANCQLMLHRENSRKNQWSIIKKEKLMNNIKQWEKKYGRYN